MELDAVGRGFCGPNLAGYRQLVQRPYRFPSCQDDGLRFESLPSTKIRVRIPAACTRRSRVAVGTSVTLPWAGPSAPARQSRPCRHASPVANLVIDIPHRPSRPPVFLVTRPYRVQPLGDGLHQPELVLDRFEFAVFVQQAAEVDPILGDDCNQLPRSDRRIPR